MIFSHRLPLRKRVFLFYMLIFITISLLFSYISIFYTGKIIRNSLYDNSIKSCTQSIGFIDYIASDYEKRLYSLIYNTKNISTIYRIYNKSFGDTEQTNYEKDLLRDMNQLLYSHSQYLNSITLYINNATFQGGSGYKIMPFSIVQDSRWCRYMNERKLSVYYTPSDNENTQGIKMYHLVSNPYNYQEYIGAVELQFDYIAFQNILASCLVTDYTYCALFSIDEAVICESGNHSAFEELICSEVLWSMNNNTMFPINNYMIYKIRSQSQDLVLLQIIPYHDVQKVQERQLSVLLVWMFLIFLLGFVFFWLVFKKSNAQLNLLSSSMKRYRQDHIQIPLVHIGDEIDSLIDDYNSMMNEIKILSEENLQKGKMLSKTELSLLYSQINPHFLFNTLDMFHWMAEEQHNESLAKAIVLLSKYYKVSLYKDQDLIPLEREIEHTSLYIQIQNLRFNNKIKFYYHIDDNLLNVAIPRITLQPIVENSILHGILPSSKIDSRIIISTEIEGGDVVITVFDNGIGMSEKQMLDILTPDGKESHGIGFYNTNNRIKLHFSSKYGLTIASELRKYTKVFIRIPYNCIGEVKGETITVS